MAIALDEQDAADLMVNAEKAASLLKSMGNEWRLMILCQLVGGDKSVRELERSIGLSQSALSQQLAVLRRKNLVKTRREAQSIYYSLNGEEVLAILIALQGLYCGKGCVDMSAASHEARPHAS